MSDDIEDLKSEAADLGITHNANIGADKLKEKIDAHYEAQETSGAALNKLVEKVAEEEPKVASAKGLDPMVAKRHAAEKAARKTRVITIVDNDQRQNNQTSTCIVNCSNLYFDLGTRVLPLNEKIEVQQGHINVLKEVFIPVHTRGKAGLSQTKTRPRYSISYEDV